MLKTLVTRTHSTTYSSSEVPAALQMLVNCYSFSERMFLGQRNFGENYVQELEEKANNAEILEKCKDIKWHYIGHLQTNKVNKVLPLPNLYLIETVDTKKLATQLNKNWPKFGAPDSKLNIMIQVNTSGEMEKNGIDPLEVTGLAEYVIKECTNLR